jgi:cytochrome c556
LPPPYERWRTDGRQELSHNGSSTVARVDVAGFSRLAKGELPMSKRDEYVASMKAQLDDMNDELDKLAAKSKTAKQEMRARYEQEMADLRAKSGQASAKLDEIKAAGKDDWESMVAEMDKIGKAFKHSYNYFKSQF